VASTEFPALDGPAGHRVNFTAVHAEIGEFAVRQAAQLSDGVTIAAPVAVVAYDIHFLTRFFPSTRGRLSWALPRNGDRLDRFPRNVRDVAAVNSEIRQVAVGQAVQLGNGVPIKPPVAVVADQVHFFSRFVFGSVVLRFEHAEDRSLSQRFEEPRVHSSNASCALHN